jgi:hemerythrin superfamily protein
VIASKRPYRIGDPIKGSLSMQIKKLSSRYVKLLEFMLEHAQMEERVIFPALERADRGLSKLLEFDV